MKKSLIFILSVFWINSSWAQKDTEFWFAAPEVTQGTGGVDYDRPVTFRFSTYESGANIVLSQPANPSFVTQSIFLPPNTSGEISSLNFGFNNAETRPANMVLNRGFLITASAPITAYYELLGGVCLCNPELFSMKGKNALGTEFYVPFQTYLPNSTAANHLPPPRASFNIVASENGTSITITPTKAIVGHAAGAAFNITLQKGQSWAGEAVGWQPDEHPSGTHIVANKPIAVTIEDDLLRGVVFGGSCSDVMGDQIIPVSKFGRRYIVQKGFLTGTEKAFVVGTIGGTQLKVNGFFVGVLGAGETFIVDIDGGQYFIEASDPVTVLQLTGNGCEVSGEIMPPLDCTGSTSVRFVRPTDEDFWLELTTQAGFEGGFVLNGNTNLIPASAFTVVPGSGGEFVAAVLSFNSFEVPSQFSSEIKNTLGKFHAGFLCGATFATGTRFGFFSDFNNQIEVQDSVRFCQGDTVLVHGISIFKEGTFSKTSVNPDGCDTLIEVKASFLPLATRSESVNFCEGDTVQVYGQTIFQPGIYTDTIPGFTGCDTIVTILAFASGLVPKQENIIFCPGDTILVYGQLIAQPGTYTVILPSLTVGCDTLVTLQANTANLIPKQVNVTFCEGDTAQVYGQTIFQPGIYTDTIPGFTGCDTIVTILAFASGLVPKQESIIFCPGDTILVYGQLIAQPGTYTAILPSLTVGCDTLVTLQANTANLIPKQVNVTFCEGDTAQVYGQTIFQPGIYTDTIPGFSHCDTLVSIVAFASSIVQKQETILICEGDTSYAYGQVITQAGVYSATLPGIVGCDTLVTLQAIVANLVQKQVNIDFCAGDSVWAFGRVFSESMVVQDTLPSQTACDTVLTIIATEHPLPVLSAHFHLCPGDSVNIAGSWYKNPAVFTAILPATGTACDTIASISISQSKLSTYLPDTLSTPWNQPLLLPLEVSSSQHTSIEWIPPTGLDNPLLQQPTATLKGPQAYQVWVKDTTGCRSEEVVWIVVEFPECESAVFVPNVFSPNDDGQNDWFTAYAKMDCITRIKTMRLYDRWGDQVFERNSFAPNEDSYGWDGYFRKKAAPSGVYVYYIELEYYDGSTLRLKGDVTLVR